MCRPVRCKSRRRDEELLRTDYDTHSFRGTALSCTSQFCLCPHPPGGFSLSSTRFQPSAHHFLSHRLRVNCPLQWEDAGATQLSPFFHR
ncbi:unnamed protein product [Protopolystoma xenopodis]|uniref:Uncharacterized protein n=1 Tax=Protopolystoma xenopodis TaxID=117903 RepID=A0A3S5AVG7_9PLAT|nr:unnamed protein product [Protopolystoma xenopodis]